MPSIMNMTPEERRDAARLAADTRRNKKIAVNAAAMTFGIEIECYVPNASIHDFRIDVGNYHRGSELPTAFPSGWTAERDGSLVDAPANFTAVEFVSPVLSGTQGIADVRQVIEFIGKPRDEGGLGAKVTSKCGQHVHVGMKSVLGNRASDFEAVSEWVRRLLHLVARNETALFAMTGMETRVNNTYCPSVKEPWKGKAGKHLGYETMRGHASNIGRYGVLNLTNLFGNKKTVEFRVFAGTLSAKKATSYIFTALGLCQKAAENTAVADWDDTPTQLVGDAAYYVKHVTDLQSRLGWLKSNVTHFGFTTQSWDLWASEVKEVMLWNARHFAERVAAH